jgi:predicted Rossmann fold flavoprotein
MEKCSTVVVGGGAAGICAAISKGRCGEPVILCEKMPQLGKKILASGNGRCNLLNEDLVPEQYNPASRELVRSVFNQCSKSELMDFFRGLGLLVYSKEGRIFPVTNQASSVLKVLEMEIRRLPIRIESSFDFCGLAFSKSGILVSSGAGKVIACQKVIVTGGGKTYPALGSDGGMYPIARQLGHTVVEPVPSAVPLVVKDPLCQILQGQRITASARSVLNGRPGEKAAGELLFTQYGLSGTCILDISETISVFLNRDNGSEAFVSVDMVPFLDKEQLKNELDNRKRKRWAAGEMLTGILPNKLCLAMKGLFEQNDNEAASASLKERLFRVSGTRGWNEAEFTCGGINVAEVKPGTLESKLRNGVYFAGEVLDANGPRGGFNLAWAWASGLVAGLTK